MKNYYKYKLSILNKTWLIDLDGTIFSHNGYLCGEDKILDGIEDFFNKNVKQGDYVLALTSREEKYKEFTENSIKKFNLRIDKIIYNLPHGERILINDKKPSGLVTALAINIDRNGIIPVEIVFDKNL